MGPYQISYALFAHSTNPIALKKSSLSKQDSLKGQLSFRRALSQFVGLLSSELHVGILDQLLLFDEGVTMIKALLAAPSPPLRSPARRVPAKGAVSLHNSSKPGSFRQEKIDSP